MALILFKALPRWLLYAVMFEHQGRRGHLSFFLSTWIPLRVRSHPSTTESLFPPLPWRMEHGHLLGASPTKPPQTLQQRLLRQRSRDHTVSTLSARVWHWWQLYCFQRQQWQFVGQDVQQQGLQDLSWPCQAWFWALVMAAQTLKLFLWSWRLWTTPCNFKHTEPFIKCKCNTKFKTHTKQMCRLMTCYEANTFVNNIQARR